MAAGGAVWRLTRVIAIKSQIRDRFFDRQVSKLDIAQFATKPNGGG